MAGRCTRWESWSPGSGGRLKVLNWNLLSFQLLEIIQVLDSTSWVRCASGNVFYRMASLSHHTDSMCIRTGHTWDFFQELVQQTKLESRSKWFSWSCYFQRGLQARPWFPERLLLIVSVDPAMLRSQVAATSYNTLQDQHLLQQQVGTLQLTGALCWPCSTSNYATICSRKTMHIAIAMRTSIVTTATTRLCWFTQ